MMCVFNCDFCFHLMSRQWTHNPFETIAKIYQNALNATLQFDFFSFFQNMLIEKKFQDKIQKIFVYPFIEFKQFKVRVFYTVTIFFSLNLNITIINNINKCEQVAEIINIWFISISLKILSTQWLSHTAQYSNVLCDTTKKREKKLCERRLFNKQIQFDHSESETNVPMACMNSVK